MIGEVLNPYPFREIAVVCKAEDVEVKRHAFPVVKHRLAWLWGTRQDDQGGMEVNAVFSDHAGLPYMSRTVPFTHRSRF